MKNLRQECKKCNIPGYVQDILINNYCPFFLKMSMIIDDENLIMKYQTNRYRPLNIELLDTKEKFILLRTIVNLIEKNEEWLIGPSNYLIEPKYIYTVNNSLSEDVIRILFYPDYTFTSFSKKIINFSMKLRKTAKSEDHYLFMQFEEIAARGDLNKIKMFLDKNILRMETEAQFVV